jgi:cytoskeletal protein CcmA (bactofilin family)
MGESMRARIRFAVVTAIAAALTLSGSASAADTKTGQEIAVAAGQQVSGDLYILGRDVVIAGTVNGDLVGAAERVSITGTVNGSVNLAARSVEVEGVVTGSVRAGGELILVSGSIDGDLVTGAKTVRISSSGEVAGDVLVGNGDLTVAGPIGGDIRGSVGDLSIGDRIGGDVRISADSVTVSNKGGIDGDLRYASNDEATLAESAQVTGSTVRTSAYRFTGGPDSWSALTSPIIRMLVMLLAGLLMVLLLPRPAIAAADAIRTAFPQSMLVGLLTVIVWPLLAIVLLVIVVGIPVAVIGSTMLMGVAYLSQVFVGLAIGRVLLPSGWKAHSRGYNVLAMAIGVILLGVVRAIPAPYVSVLVAVVVAILGIGGALLALHGARSPDPSPA